MKPNAHISDELAEFLECGLSIVVATRDGDLEPDGALAWAARVEAERDRLTVFLYEEAAAHMLRNLERFPEIALDFDLPTTHRACQVKGLFLASRPARDSERPLVERQVEGFRKDLEKIGIPYPMFGGWKTWPCVAFDVRVTHLFEQTPGPGAGEPLPAAKGSETGAATSAEAGGATTAARGRSKGKRKP